MASASPDLRPVALRAMAEPLSLGRRGARLRARRRTNMLKGFRDFLMRGNVVDLATAVIIGVAFNGVVDGLIKGIIDPLIAVLAPGDVKDLQNALVLGPFHIGLVLSALDQLRPEGRGRLLLHRPALRQLRGQARGRAAAAARGRAAAHRDPRPAEGPEVESPPDGPGRRPAARPGGAPCFIARGSAPPPSFSCSRPPWPAAAAAPRRRPPPPTPTRRPLRLDARLLGRVRRAGRPRPREVELRDRLHRQRREAVLHLALRERRASRTATW